MRKNEKQTVIILGVLIIIIAVVMAVMLFSGRDTGNSSSDGSLRDAVQQESNSQEEEGSDVSEGEDAADQAPEEDVSGDEQTADDEDTSEETDQTSTEETKNKTASEIMDADDGYIFPDVDTTYLSKSSVEKLSDSELQYAVNEVYARHGLKFTKKINKERFEKKSWYKGTVSDQDSISLNKYEKKNVDTMASELKKRGLR